MRKKSDCMVHRRTYKKHKKTKHRTIFIPEGFDFVKVEKDEHQSNAIKIVFKKKR